MFLTSPFIDQALSLKTPVQGILSVMGIYQQLFELGSTNHFVNSPLQSIFVALVHSFERISEKR
jgi:hypothetical protein